MQKRTTLAAAAALGAAAILAACGGGDDGPRDVSIEFTALAGTTAVKCGTVVSGLGSGNVDAKVKDLRFYIANVQLLRADGSKVALALPANNDWNYTSGEQRLTLIDLEDATGDCSAGTPATNATIQGTVPAGDYVGVEMTMGVPFALNHSDYATAIKPLDVQAMAWSWQSGRKFAKVEVTDPLGTAGTWVSKTFNFHLGSTGCVGNPASGQTVSCTAANRMVFGFSSFDPSKQKIALDVKALLAGTDITVNQASAPGCMSGGTDPECLNVFKALAIDWQADGTGSGLPVNNGAAQTLFKAVAK